MKGLFPPSSFRLHPFQFRRLRVRLDVNRIGECERRNTLWPDARLFALGLVPERLQHFVRPDGNLVNPHADRVVDRVGDRGRDGIGRASCRERVFRTV